MNSKKSPSFLTKKDKAYLAFGLIVIFAYTLHNTLTAFAYPNGAYFIGGLLVPLFMGLLVTVVIFLGSLMVGHRFCWSNFVRSFIRSVLVVGICLMFAFLGNFYIDMQEKDDADQYSKLDTQSMEYPKWKVGI